MYRMYNYLLLSRSIPSVQLQRQKLIDRGLDPDDIKNKFVPYFLLENLQNEYKHFDAVGNLKEIGLSIYPLMR